MTIARLPRALQRAGFEVGLVCSERGHLATTRFRDRTFFLPRRLRGAALVRQLTGIVREWNPDLVLPGDDDAAVFLGRVCAERSDARDADAAALVALLHRSLGNPTALTEAASKRRTVERARLLGLRVPACSQADTLEVARAAACRAGYPVVLKRSSGCAGDGVAICRSDDELAAAWRRLSRERTARRRLRAWRHELSGRRLSSRWLPNDTGLTVDQYIPGESAMCQVAAAGGRVLAAATALKVRGHPAVTGPSSVLRFVEGGEMLAAATALVGAWRLSGLIAFDFVVDVHGHAWLLECNPRAIALAHLSPLAGDDLCEALYCHSAALPSPVPRERRNVEVALFPQEWRRDPASPHLDSAYHDVPWDDPTLLRSLIGSGSRTAAVAAPRATAAAG